MQIFCIMYYTLSYLQIVPQIFKLTKTKSSNDYSLGQVIIALLAMLSWGVYVFLTPQPTLVRIGTAIDVSLIIITDIFIFMYYKNK